MSELPNISILACDGCVTNYVGFSQSSVNACTYCTMCVNLYRPTPKWNLNFIFLFGSGGGGAVVWNGLENELKDEINLKSALSLP